MSKCVCHCHLASEYTMQSHEVYEYANKRHRILGVLRNEFGERNTKQYRKLQLLANRIMEAAGYVKPISKKNICSVCGGEF